MNYPESVEFLYKLGNEVKTIKLGLERITAVLDAFGNPQKAYRVVHVAGTNGKGSVCAMIDAGLRAAGVRSGMFTSPHLIEPTERIQIDGLAVSRVEFERAFNVVHEVAGKLDLDVHPTYFETVTAMALWLFRERGVETAVVEVGLGGRLDATNVVAPALTVITQIDMDHQAYLGNTIEEIAGEKAGILKRGVATVFSRQRRDALRVLDARALELGVPVTYFEEFAIRDLQVHARGSSFSGIHCPLAGEHQVDNAVTAAQALQALGVAAAGIEETRWPGRLEHVTPNPDTILDGAHNPAGAEALAKYLRRFYGDRRKWMIFGAMRDKAVDEVAGILFPLADELIFTAPAGPGDRAVRPETLQGIAGRGHCEADVKAALDYALGRVAAEDVIVITGSLYLVGEARGLFLAPTGGRW
ncbi:MAG: folylpolyglutamate synthase/dihydrofolate synthase family protein [Acidobacteriota bacterium]